MFLTLVFGNNYAFLNLKTTPVDQHKLVAREYMCFLVVVERLERSLWGRNYVWKLDGALLCDNAKTLSANCGRNSNVTGIVKYS